MAARSQYEEQPEVFQGYTGPNRWMLPYADMLTLLVGFLVVSVMWVIPPPAVKPRVVATVPQKNLAKILAPVVKNLEGTQVLQTSRGVVVSLSDAALFAPGEAQWRNAEATQKLEALGKTLRALPNDIRIEGHTDNTPIHTNQYPSNWELSSARATRVVQYLVDTQHVAPERLSAMGYGEFRPVAENSSVYGKQKNRRVDIVILGK